MCTSPKSGIHSQAKSNSNKCLKLRRCNRDVEVATRQHKRRQEVHTVGGYDVQRLEHRKSAGQGYRHHMMQNNVAGESNESKFKRGSQFLFCMTEQGAINICLLAHSSVGSLTDLL